MNLIIIKRRAFSQFDNHPLVNNVAYFLTHVIVYCVHSVNVHVKHSCSYAHPFVIISSELKYGKYVSVLRSYTPCLAEEQLSRGTFLRKMLHPDIAIGYRNHIKGSAFHEFCHLDRKANQ